MSSCASQPCTFASQVPFADERARGTGEFDSRDVFRAICELQEEGRYEGSADLENRPSVPRPQTAAEARLRTTLG